MSKWYKFYICEFVNTKHKMRSYDDCFLKFGITHHMDVLKRFDPKVDDGYIKNYQDWKIFPKYSKVLYSYNEAKKLEDYYNKVLYPNPGPNKVWVENYFNLEDNNYYDNCSGITELRLFTRKQANYVVMNAYKMLSKDDVEQKRIIREELKVAV